MFLLMLQLNVESRDTPSGHDLAIEGHVEDYTIGDSIRIVVPAAEVTVQTTMDAETAGDCHDEVIVGEDPVNVGISAEIVDVIADVALDIAVDDD
ncbi:hypothetical protein V6N12_025010 [Hibiscus sabdariffa]|uniref:Uncharacterized protein n=1 Tax=Hibiscus sabdariffa TaxID=183260 RepID=A0ABR2AJL7_9ROSI